MFTRGLSICVHFIFMSIFSFKIKSTNRLPRTVSDLMGCKCRQFGVTAVSLFFARSYADESQRNAPRPKQPHSRAGRKCISICQRHHVALFFTGVPAPLLETRVLLVVLVLSRQPLHRSGCRSATILRSLLPLRIPCTLR